MEKIRRNKIRNRAFYLTFHKGIKAWILLVAVCFVFSFLGVSESSQTDFIGKIDGLLGLNQELTIGNIEVLDKFILNNEVINKISFGHANVIAELINIMSKDNTWFLNLLAANFAYFQRNPGEVIFYLAIVSIISLAVKIFIKNVLILGKVRYFMENRYEKNVKFSRTLSLFTLKNDWNLIKVMFAHNFVLSLWELTIIGGVYKHYQYKMVPYIVAENPKISWKKAKKMSAEMTKGYKFKIFLTELSFFYMSLFRMIPGLGLLISLPFEAVLSSEYYFSLRERFKDRKTIFVEEVFNKEPYGPGNKNNKPNYLLDDIAENVADVRKKVKTDIKRSSDYSLADYIFFFFAFCFAGYIWEVSLFLVQHHEFVNRGTMYGPWLPIYGCGGVAIIFFLNPFKEKKTTVFFTTMGICAVLEYLTSWILEFMFNSSYWDYNEMVLNVNGRICLAGLIAFGLGGLFGIYIAAPKLSGLLDKLGKKKTRIILATLVIIFIIDTICCYTIGFNTGSNVGGAI